MVTGAERTARYTLATDSEEAAQPRCCLHRKKELFLAKKSGYFSQRAEKTGKGKVCRRGGWNLENLCLNLPLLCLSIRILGHLTRQREQRSWRGLLA